MNYLIAFHVLSFKMDDGPGEMVQVLHCRLCLPHIWCCFCDKQMFEVWIYIVGSQMLYCFKKRGGGETEILIHWFLFFCFFNKETERD